MNNDDDEIITASRWAVAGVILGGVAIFGLTVYGIVSLAWRVFG
jgi:uncharacterized membrane protein YqhA